MDSKQLRELTNKLKIQTLKQISKEGKGSSGSCLSCLEILIYLYFKEGFLKQDPKNFRSAESDYFILSKITATKALYEILKEKGFIDSTEDLPYKLSKDVNGVHFSLNEEGLGLPLAAGIAMGLKVKKRNNKVICLIEDSEILNGTTYEAAHLTGKNKLDNLLLIVDNNYTPGDAKLTPGSVDEKLRACGFRTLTIMNGHSFEEIDQAITKALTFDDSPKAIIFKTIKGKGVKFMENKSNYYYSPLSEQELTMAINEIQN
jgi:transketolase